MSNQHPKRESMSIGKPPSPIYGRLPPLWKCSNGWGGSLRWDSGGKRLDRARMQWTARSEGHEEQAWRELFHWWLS
jgi:hypothetical protein